MDDKDIKLILAHVQDLIYKVDKRGSIECTHFYNPAEAKKVQLLLSEASGTEFIQTGGFSDAERKLFIICPSKIHIDEQNFLDTIRLSWPANHYDIIHRDVLGALMGLGLKRERIGDIAMGTGEAYVIVHHEVSGFIINNLIKAGNAPISAEVVDINSIVLPQLKTKCIRTTVASPRLDSMASACFGLSRAKILPYIKGGSVMVNHEAVTKADYVVNEGDILSVRGLGKGKASYFGGKTKKDRLAVSFERYI